MLHDGAAGDVEARTTDVPPSGAPGDHGTAGVLLVSCVCAVVGPLFTPSLPSAFLSCLTEGASMLYDGAAGDRETSEEVVATAGLRRASDERKVGGAMSAEARMYVDVGSCFSPSLSFWRRVPLRRRWRRVEWCRAGEWE